VASEFRPKAKGEWHKKEKPESLGTGGSALINQSLKTGGKKPEKQERWEKRRKKSRMREDSPLERLGAGHVTVAR